MKKFLTAVVSFALILFLGVAAGCSTKSTVTYKVSLINNSENVYLEHKDGVYTVVSRNDAGDTEIGEGVDLKIHASSAKTDKYTITGGSLTEATEMKDREIVVTITAESEFTIHATDEKAKLNDAKFKIKVRKFVAETPSTPSTPSTPTPKE